MKITLHPRGPYQRSIVSAAATQRGPKGTTQQESLLSDVISPSEGQSMLDGACRVRSCLKGSSVCWLTGGEGRVSNDTVSQSSPDIYGLQKYLSDEQNRCYIIQVSQLRRLFSIFTISFFFAHFITPSLSQPFLQHQYLFLSFCLSSHRIHILDRGYSVREGNVRYLLQFKTRQSQGERKSRKIEKRER